ncbi:MAG TPA: sigma-54-dependent Fis family transcriptional regulator, partial [Enterococcus columbae]|nr:sigma-54-dependent Fis family transcriptional regulator [Enterococcus columbae]
MKEDTWKRFINGDEGVLTSLPTNIADSWKNCHSHQVDPFLRKPRKVMTLSEIKQKQRENKVLIQLVKEEVKKIKYLFNIQYPLFILTDSEGTILWRDGHHQAKDYANDIYFNVGSRWAELDVGTNAIGMVLTLKKEATMSLNDHYAVASRNWGCAASPIFDCEQKLIGVLDISTYNNDSVQDSIFLLNTLTQRISNDYIHDELQKKVELLKYASRNLSEEILCDLHFQIVYLPETLQEDFELNRDIRLQLAKEEIYEKQEIYLLDELIGYRFKIYPTLKRKQQKQFQIVGIQSQNPNYQIFLRKVEQLANSSVPVHVYGESGSGKEIIAKTIHLNSPFKEGPLIVVNCGALSEDLLESELFGYAPGSFTGANQEGYEGKILQANHGSLFLDEIDSMSYKMQTALLRVLEEKKVIPINGKQQSVEFRLITASNQDLRKRVIEKKFREDLFYRIYVGKLEIPPLRERIEDLQPLIDLFCQRKNWYIPWKDKIYAVARTFHWPGNIREFNNFLERLYIFYPDREPTSAQILEIIQLGSLENISEEENNQKEEILSALAATHYHVTNAAKKLGISR